MTVLEREIQRMREAARDLLLGPTPFPDHPSYLAIYARHQVLSELEDFIAERKKRAEATGDDDDNE